MLRQAGAFILLGMLVWAGWKLWQPPAVSVQSRPVVQNLPERPGETVELWRVVTRRMIVPKAVKELGKALRERGLPPVITLARKEAVVLHAFDDPRSFDRREDAVRARNDWRKAGFDAELIKPDEHFGVALGRLYMAAYARALQHQLELAKRPYTYHRRQVSIPTWHFTFAAAPYAEASRLWSRVQALGVADPVLMRESRFRVMFDHVSADSPDP